MNSVQISGRLCSAPNYKVTDTGTDVCNLRLAVESRVKGQETPNVAFISVATFGKLACACSDHLIKGQMVEVQGELRSREWDGDDGQHHQVTLVYAAKVNFLAKPQSYYRQKEADKQEELKFDDQPI